MLGMLDISGHLEQSRIRRLGISWMVCREAQFIHSNIFKVFISGVDIKFMHLINFRSSRLGMLGMFVID